MVTQLDIDIPGELAPVIEEYGKLVTFRTFPDRVENTSDSSVDLGTPVDHDLKVTPPDMVSVKLQGDGSGIETAAQRVILLTLNGTANAITFTPEIGSPVIIDGSESVIVRVDPIYSGDLIAAYEVFLEV